MMILRCRRQCICSVSFGRSVGGCEVGRDDLPATLKEVLVYLASMCTDNILVRSASMSPSFYSTPFKALCDCQFSQSIRVLDAFCILQGLFFATHASNIFLS
mmetsp:Transcript_28367/g.69020  ORF Transcript_28367/g.69020 Transcript_28367/m.69020 type:complete len:102 (+) Transcript_28367:1388-1693(+)